MIARYTRPEMGRIWEPENRYRKWLDVEIAACEAWAELGDIPKEAVEVIKAKADFNVARIDEIEQTVKHDVIAFLTSVAEFVGDESRFIHKGMTSSDVLDTSLALQLREAADLILADIDRLMEVLKTRALEHKDTVTIGRSHGIHAEPVTFGLKMALWYEEMKRNRSRMERAREVISVGMFSGAVGTFANIKPEVEEIACKRLGLKPAPVSTQVIQRDRHAEYMSALAMIAATLEKIAVEIRHLQRTEVLEAEEYFSEGQKGSSAMPHKRNPIASENICGLSRLVRSNAMAAIENIPLWHERDISHSSVERVILPDSTILVDYMLNRFTGVIKNLLVYPENMMKNLELTGGLFNSQRVMLALTEKGVLREDAYRLVQRNAMRTWKEKIPLQELLLADADIRKHLSEDEVKGCSDLEYHTRNVDYIFRRVFGA
ncbi:MAG: adenylosuccinate lyase [Nitrospirota bacterium]|nr:adenylosuccinate lyase [Nitrospirota bacterium]